MHLSRSSFPPYFFKGLKRKQCVAEKKRLVSVYLKKLGVPTDCLLSSEDLLLHRNRLKRAGSHHQISYNSGEILSSNPAGTSANKGLSSESVSDVSHMYKLLEDRFLNSGKFEEVSSSLLEKEQQCTVIDECSAFAPLTERH